MTIEEFKEKFKELMDDLNATNDNEYNIFVFVYHIETKDGFSFGYGCPACAAECIIEDYNDGIIQHHNKSKAH